MYPQRRHHRVWRLSWDGQVLGFGRLYATPNIHCSRSRRPLPRHRSPGDSLYTAGLTRTPPNPSWSTSGRTYLAEAQEQAVGPVLFPLHALSRCMFFGDMASVRSHRWWLQGTLDFDAPARVWWIRYAIGPTSYPLSPHLHPITPVLKTSLAMGRSRPSKRVITDDPNSSKE